MAPLRSPKANSPTGSQGKAMEPPREGVGLGMFIAGPLTPLVAMMDFRKLLIDRFHNMDEAIENLCQDNADPRRMDKKDFRRALQSLHFNLSKDERDAVFKHLDING